MGRYSTKIAKSAQKSCNYQYFVIFYWFIECSFDVDVTIQRLLSFDRVPLLLPGNVGPVFHIYKIGVSTPNEESNNRKFPQMKE